MVVFPFENIYPDLNIHNHHPRRFEHFLIDRGHKIRYLVRKGTRTVERLGLDQEGREEESERERERGRKKNRDRENEKERNI